MVARDDGEGTRQSGDLTSATPNPHLNDKGAVVTAGGTKWIAPERIARFLSQHWAISGILAAYGLVELAGTLGGVGMWAYRAVAHEAIQARELNQLRLGQSSAYQSELLGPPLATRPIGTLDSDETAVQRIHKDDNFVVVTYTPGDSDSVSEFYVVACPGFEPTLGNGVALNRDVLSDSFSDKPPNSFYNQPPGNPGSYFEWVKGANVNNYNTVVVGRLDMCFGKEQHGLYPEEWPDSNVDEFGGFAPGMTCSSFEDCSGKSAVNTVAWREQFVINTYGLCDLECKYFDGFAASLLENLSS